ncbi:uncharacterized protein LOC124169783 isoform X2 [Ischnura elegans]|nr:uncharacterized protein LOC124169783 isoform X2 [Ischnura elegans]
MEYFTEIDEEEYCSTILQCLQDDPSLKIIFDFSSSNIHGIHPFQHGQNWGLTNFKVNRIYVAAKETEEFKHRGIISNLAHECAHKAYALVFENGGLPYRQDDGEAKKEYEYVVETVLSDERLCDCDPIIQRAAGYNKKHELIVRVPEMMSKYHTQSNEDSTIGNGMDHLVKQAPELLRFYDERVQGELEDYIKRNIVAGKYKYDDWLNTAMLSDYCDNDIQVNSSFSTHEISHHNLLQVFQVSNLKLGVSHLRQSLKDVMFVDWTRYLKDTSMLKIGVRKNDIKNLAVVWDKKEKPWFCGSSKFCSGKCIRNSFGEEVRRSLILILPLEVRVPKSISCVNYTWNDLSEGSKRFLLEKELYFGGDVLKLRDLLETLSEKDAELKHDAELLSKLIDEGTIEIGRPLKTILGKRVKELLHKHNCFIQRNLVLSKIEFNRHTFVKRADDAFFISKARRKDLEDVGVGPVYLWKGEENPVDARCFILTGEHNFAHSVNLFREISEIIDWNSKRGGKLHFVHFFELIHGDYCLIGSINCRHLLKNEQFAFECSGVSLLESDATPNEVLLVADAPGSGKSVFVNKMALEMKKKYRKCWIDVIELLLFEDSFKVWENKKCLSQDSVEDLLYDLLKTGSQNQIEEKFFQLFFRNGNKVFIFFDGFDEICPTYRDIVGEFVGILKNFSNVKMCLTTRVHEAGEMEDKFSTLAYKFVPFNHGDQIQLLNLEWNASLCGLSLDERKEKIENIVAALQTTDNLRRGQSFSKLHQDLTCLSNGGKNCIIEFNEVADQLIKMGESAVEDEVNFSENPLHAWMLAYVVFEENFEIEKSLNPPQLYDKYVNIKVKMYSREKLRSKASVLGDARDRGFEDNMYKLLKKFSAYYFLGDEEFELDEDKVQDMLLVGLVERIRNSIVFVHRTLGEYIFSLWLLEKCEKKKVTKVTLKKVLLEKQFHKVRQFINSMLVLKCGPRSEAKAKQSVGKKTPLLKRLKFDDQSMEKQFVESIQKCIYMSILECHIGVTQFLSESFKDLLIDIMFCQADWDIKMLEFPVIHENGHWNAFTFCGRCIRGKVGITYSEMSHHPSNVGNTSEYKSGGHSELDYLKYLTELLQLIEKRNLAVNLSSVISQEGVSWMGFNEFSLWSCEKGRGYFSFLFNFFERNKKHLSDALKSKIFEDRSDGFFQNGAVFLFEMLVQFLESIFELPALVKLIASKNNVLKGWCHVFQTCGVEDVKKMWNYLKSMLETKEDRIRVLKAVDGRGKNAIYSACANWENREVLPFVWIICQEEMTREEFRVYLFESFSRTMDSVMLKADRLLDCVSDAVANGSLDRSDAVRLLNMVDENDWHYLISVYTTFSPRYLFKIQEFLISADLDSQEILKNMKNYYLWLAPSCFERLDQYNKEEGFISEVEQEFELILPIIQSFPFADLIRSDKDGYLIGILDEYQRKIEGIHLKLFLVLLRRQLRLESSILGKEQLITRLSEEFIWIYDQFPFLLYDGRSGKTKSLFISCFVAMMLEYLSEEQVSAILLYSQRIWGNIFYYVLRKDDLNAYYKCYEVAKFVIGENNLGKVDDAKVGNTTVREMLQRKLNETT